MNLTPKEKNVIRKLAEGLTVKEVAVQLFVAPSTIVTHKKHIFQKMEVRTLVELGVQAVRQGIVTSIIIIIFGLCFSNYAAGQIVPALNADIPPSQGFASMANIEASFTNARRQEEIQLGLANGALSNLELPEPAFWNVLTDEQQMLFLINEERSARDGIEYIQPESRNNRKRIIPVCLPSFEGILLALDQIAQAHADYLRENNLFTHTDADGNEPQDRFDLSEALAGFYRALIVVESIAAFGSTDLNNLTQVHIDAIYTFLYEDISSFSKHREMLLVAKFDMLGYLEDDYGEMGKEGFLGIGIAEGPYAGLPFGKVFVLDAIDPLANAPFMVHTDTDIINRIDCPNQSHLSGFIGPPLDGTFNSSGSAEIDAYLMASAELNVNTTNFALFKENFQVENGSTLSVNMNGCEDD